MIRQMYLQFINIDDAKTIINHKYTLTDDQLIVIVNILDIPRIRTDWLAKRSGCSNVKHV